VQEQSSKKQIEIDGADVDLSASWRPKSFWAKPLAYIATKVLGVSTVPPLLALLGLAVIFRDQDFGVFGLIFFIVAIVTLGIAGMIFHKSGK
jgi:hypothetical protein